VTLLVCHERTRRAWAGTTIAFAQLRLTRGPRTASSASKRNVALGMTDRDAVRWVVNRAGGSRLVRWSAWICARRDDPPLEYMYLSDANDRRLDGQSTELTQEAKR
jgi:hypothetical protein